MRDLAGAALCHLPSGYFRAITYSTMATRRTAFDVAMPSASLFGSQPPYYPEAMTLTFSRLMSALRDIPFAASNRGDLHARPPR